MHPVEHVLYFSSVLIHFVIPSHPLHVVFHMYSLSLSAVIGHTGYSAMAIKGRKIIDLGHFHHQLHHRYFEVNYGTTDIPCDEWFGSFDDGTPEARANLRYRNRVQDS